jgi:hypothetical protein
VILETCKKIEAAHDQKLAQAAGSCAACSRAACVDLCSVKVKKYKRQEKTENTGFWRDQKINYKRSAAGNCMTGVSVRFLIILYYTAPIDGDAFYDLIYNETHARFFTFIPQYQSCACWCVHKTWMYGKI